MTKKIVSVGVHTPSKAIHRIDFLSKKSLLDYDVVIFTPELPYIGGYDRYQGKTCLSDDESFRMRDVLSHWRKELSAAFDAGKPVLVFLEDPIEVYAATGEMKYSGTGRNSQKTRIVSQISSYDALPIPFAVRQATGSSMSIVPEARYLTAYWSEFAQASSYKVYLEGNITEPVITTKSGGRIVGAVVRKHERAMLLLPPITNPEEISGKKKTASETTTSKSITRIEFGKRFTTAIVALADSIVARNVVVPPPAWTLGEQFRLPREVDITAKIQTIETEIENARRRISDLRPALEEAVGLRALLYEQGQALENAIHAALRLIGFTVSEFRDHTSQFDVVFVSHEGRFIGEAEGKDKKPINIEKFSQLERNLNEDFAKDNVNTFAKGVLFGNAFRLQPPDERESPFTEKCITSAKRLGVALIHTPDLFEPAKYLSTTRDEDYSRQCRVAILDTSGEVVRFPKPPA